ncbi:hypothetical protein O9K51_00001 [Purpureocillium lavendulum]|uniref:Uncharacterized protein n=1 Tax=Purpureocillium lavendulum TaxID=1247861 RepID=A0AB34G0T1_9HYPO|nr:hypothetical protein O9K51_00001 [Purpureocillium lavendulum]
MAVKKESGKKAEQTLDIATLTRRALIDLTEVDTRDIDYKKLERDCELLKDVINNNHDEIGMVLRLVCSGKATLETIGSTAATLDKIGFTEKAFRDKGGGLIGLIVVAVACMLIAGCDGCAHTDWAKRK